MRIGDYFQRSVLTASPRKIAGVDGLSSNHSANVIFVELARNAVPIPVEVAQLIHTVSHFHETHVCCAVDLIAFEKGIIITKPLRRLSDAERSGAGIAGDNEFADAPNSFA